MSDSMRVWKFVVPMPLDNARAWVDMPGENPVPLSVGLQGEELVVWALVNPDEGATGPRRLIVANTGQEIPGFPEGARFLGTFTHPGGIVWHVWDGDAEVPA